MVYHVRVRKSKLRCICGGWGGEGEEDKRCPRGDGGRRVGPLSWCCATIEDCGRSAVILAVHTGAPVDVDGS